MEESVRILGWWGGVFFILGCFWGLVTLSWEYFSRISCDPRLKNDEGTLLFKWYMELLLLSIGYEMKFYVIEYGIRLIKFKRVFRSKLNPKKYYP